jgi:hypothetical protein
MKDFDIQISMNGVENELNSNFIEENSVITNSDSRKKNDIPQEKDKSWIDTLDNVTKVFKDATGYKTIKQQQAKNEKELAERGEKYKVLGMNPFVAIGLSLVVIIGTSIAVTKIKAG